jgi:hypothetical protein
LSIERLDKLGTYVQGAICSGGAIITGTQGCRRKRDDQGGA